MSGLDLHILEGRDHLAYQLAQLAVRAGQEILNIYRMDDQGIRLKADQSPVTLADERAEAVIIEGLRLILPDVPIIAEEAFGRGERPQTSSCLILVDALDGTREFINRNGEFTVNIAVIEHGKPVCGTVYAPALGCLWFGADHAFTCTIDPLRPHEFIEPRAIHCRKAPAGLIALKSRSHHDPQTDLYLQRLPIISTQTLGSSLKICKIAEGEADVYVRHTPTMEWDIAAGHAVLHAAGGCLTDMDGASLVYGKHDLHNPPFICWGDPHMKNKAF
jgi:3'(2'), 5'-bisphosphate nucleotidase